jgi:hypothetical protein
MDLSLNMVREVPKTIAHHWSKGQINWPMGIYVAFAHALAFKGLFHVTKCSAETLFFAFCLWPIR